MDEGGGRIILILYYRIKIIAKYKAIYQQRLNLLSNNIILMMV